MSGPKADEQQLATTHTVTPASPGVGAVSGAAPATPSALPVPGDVISSKYRIEQCLGQGGMGAVFRATHLLSEKRVAVKWMLRPASDAQATGRFVREARAAARIEHENVVDVYDVGEHNGYGYLVMELLRGESLAERLGRARLGVTEAIDLLLPAMRGVVAAHAAGVIHRDLKPHNVFLCAGSDGIAREAKVLDFGISSFTNADASDAALTQEGTILGTPAYMSPEQLRSSSKLDPRTDVYSMGVILYEAVAGRVPFDDPSFTSLVLAIANADPPPPRVLRPELSVELEQVMMRAMARDRQERFQDMGSFIAALEPFASFVTTSPAVSGTRLSAVRDLPAVVDRLTLSIAPDPEAEIPVPIALPDAAAVQRRAAAAASARTRVRWPGMLAIAMIVAIVGWWLAGGGRSARRAEQPEHPVIEAEEPRVAAEAREAARESPAAAASAGLAGTAPAATPEDSIPPAQPAMQTVPARTSPVSAELDRPARVTPRPASNAPSGNAVSTTPEPPGAAKAKAAPVGRSGSLSVDDML